METQETPLNPENDLSGLVEATAVDPEAAPIVIESQAESEMLVPLTTWATTDFGWSLSHVHSMRIAQDARRQVRSAGRMMRAW
jgi:hypothetical protein